jgi:capsular polysaccharide transport system permease protein
MFKDLLRQFNIIKALVIHDLQGQMKSYNYGFVWMLLEPLIYIVAFRMIRKAFGSSAPPGMTPLMFYTLGVFPLYFFIAGLAAGRSAAKRSSLLYFPRVTQIDVALGTGVSKFTINFVVFMLMVPAVSAYEGVLLPQNLNLVFFSIMICWTIGIGAGFALSGLMRVFPPITEFVSYVLFGLRMASGMFFCSTEIPPMYWPYLAWNPLFHATELARDGWFEGFTSPIANPMFMLECALGCLLFGLSVERFMRRVPYV